MLYCNVYTIKKINTMAILSKNKLNELILNTPPLIENMVDAKIQIQTNGIDLTLKQIELLDGSGAVDFDNLQRKIPHTSIHEFDDIGWAFLMPGCYKIIFNEIVNIPKNISALAKPRSSLLRCGATLETAVWDAGYSGRSECMLVVHNKSGFRVKKDARIMQLLFFELDEIVEEGYIGIYQNENKC